MKPVNTKYVGPNYEQIIKEAEENQTANVLLTLPQVAAVLQVNQSTVRRLLQSGDIPYVNISTSGHVGKKGVRVAISDLNDWIESRRLVAWGAYTEDARLGTGGSRTMTAERCDAALGRLTDAKHNVKLGPYNPS